MMRRIFFLISVLIPALSWGAVLNINKFSGLNTDDSTLVLQNGQTPDSENVVTDDGLGLQGRKGFVRFSTEPATDVWEFPKSDGTRYIIVNTGTGYLKADTGDGVFNISVSTVPTNRVVSGSVLGDRFYFVDNLNGLKYWDGSSVVVASATLTFTNLVTWKGRLAGAGIAAASRVIYLSKYLDGTSWTAPVNPSDDDAAQITVSGALDENIQALFASFQDKLMWYKINSFGGIYGSRRSNFIQRTFSDNIGVSSKETIRDCDGKLRWLGRNRIVWEFDGATFKKISEDVDDLFSDVSQGDTASKSNTQTSQSQWELGSQSPSSPTNFASATDIIGSITPKTTTFLDTDSNEWDVGTESPLTAFSSTDTIGSLKLADAPAIADFVDTSTTDFDAGTLTGLSSRITAHSLTLATTTTGNVSACSSGSDDAVAFELAFGVPLQGYRTFSSTKSFFLTGVELRLKGSDSLNRDTTVILTIRSGSASGTILANQTFTKNPTTSFSNIACDLTTPIILSSGTTYWLIVKAYHAISPSTYPTYWAGSTPNCDSSHVHQMGTGSQGSNGRFKYAANGYSYEPSGNIVSQTFDNGFTTNTWLWNWSTLEASWVMPSAGGITFETQTSANASDWDSLISVTTGSSPASTVRRYIRYKSSLTTTDTSTSPVINDVTLNMGSRIRTHGTFTSRTFDTGMTIPQWGLFERTLTQQGGGGSSLFQTQSSADGVSWDSAVTASSGTQITSNEKRYLRYIWQSTATSISAYDRLDDLTITAKSTGTYTTQSITVGNAITSWGPVIVNGADSGGSYIIQFGTSTDGATFTYTTITNNTTPSVSTAPYAAVRFIFALDVATDTPRVDDVTINWTEGSSVRAASIYYKQRYWLSVAISSSNNNRIFLYDKNNAWQRYSNINADTIGLYNSQMYFGNSGGIFQGETGYNDNGSSISSYYKTPDQILSSLDLYNHFDALYLTADNSDSEIETDYQINGINTDYALGDYTMNTTPGIQNFKLPFSQDEVQTGKYINFKWTVSGTTFWRLLNGALYFEPMAEPE